MINGLKFPLSIFAFPNSDFNNVLEVKGKLLYNILLPINVTSYEVYKTQKYYSKIKKYGLQDIILINEKFCLRFACQNNTLSAVYLLVFYQNRCFLFRTLYNIDSNYSVY